MSVPPAALGEGARRLLAGYRPRPGLPDELVDDGGIRPAWRDLVEHLGALSPSARRRAFARGAQHLADAGVFHRPYGDRDAAPRPWPFAPVPIVLAEAEWDGIAAGLRQRADLLEAVVADLYGAGRLVAEGLIPAQVVADSPEWLRPLVGVVPRGGHFLHLVAFEIGRGADGRWRVLEDRVDAPSGAGYALETRVAAGRAFPDLHREARVHRLAGFFRDLRDALEILGGGPGRVGILTPGALTDTYYEQAYVARYLGIPLLQGDDLSVDDGELCLRTVRGPRPVGALWRRLDGPWADPLELRPESRLGTPGLVEAARRGGVALVNALGAGVLETQALMAFLPAIAERLTGRPLALPNVAAWWCGDDRARAHVRAHAASMTVGPALATRAPWETGAPHAVAGVMRGGDAADADAWIEAGRGALVGREIVALSTAPVWEGEGLVPRPMSIRVFLARAEGGWSVMPGGFGRVGRGPDPSAVALREGGFAADVWVASDRPVAPVSLLGPPGHVRADEPALPSRAADDLLWLGRYVERAEGLMRLSRALHARLAEGAEPALASAVGRVLDGYGADASQAIPDGIREALDAAVRAAGQLRDRFSVDGWAALTDLQRSMGRMAGTARPGADAAAATGALLRKAAGFAGLVHENMVRGEGWLFLTAGRAIERAAVTADLLASLADPGAPPGSLDLLVEVGDSVMVHRRRHAVLASRASVLDVLAFDGTNPRALRFQAALLADRLGNLKGGGAVAAEAEALGRALDASGTFGTAALRAWRGGVLRLSDALHEAFLR